MYTDISTVNKMFPNPSMAVRPPFGYPGQAQYFGNGSDGKMPYALTFTGKDFYYFYINEEKSTLQNIPSLFLFLLCNGVRFLNTRHSVTITNVTF